MNWYKLTKKAAEFWGKEGSGLLIVCQEDNTALLTLRSREVEQPGTWGIPGGAVKTGNPDDEDCFEDSDDEDREKFSTDMTFGSAREETREELGCLPSQMTTLDSYVYTHGAFKFTTYIVGITAKEKATFTKMIRLNWENDEFRWVPVGSLASLNLHFGVKDLIHNHKNLASRSPV